MATAGADREAVYERVRGQYDDAAKDECEAFLVFMAKRDVTARLAQILGIPHGYPTRTNPTADLKSSVSQSSAGIYRFEAIVRVLQSSGAPMQLRSIVEALTALPNGGYTDSTIHQTLKASPDVFTPIRRGIYDLAPEWRNAPIEQARREAVMRSPAQVRETRKRRSKADGSVDETPG